MWSAKRAIAQAAEDAVNIAWAMRVATSTDKATALRPNMLSFQDVLSMLRDLERRRSRVQSRSADN